MRLKISNFFALSVFTLFITFNVSTAKNTNNHSSKLPESIINLLKKNDIPETNLSVYARDLSEETALIEHNINTRRNPASTMKLLTTYAALNELKPNFKWRTEAWISGRVENGVLKGDLILKGYGDPFLVKENYWKFIQGIREKGLREITGHIVIDNSYFDLPEFNSGAFDGKPYRLYNATPSALMYDYQATRFLLRPDIKNKKVDVVPYPRSSGLSYSSEVKLEKGGCKRRHYFPEFIKTVKQITITGSYSSSCGQQYLLRSFSDPEQHAYDGFKEIWQGMGGKIRKGIKKGNVQKGNTLYHVYTSNSLGDQIRVINKWSNNVMTRQLLLTLGAVKYGAPGTLEKGRKAILESLTKNGIDNTGIIIDNGSGLSREARITTKQHAQLLASAWKNKFMPEFMSSLSLSGFDGTLLNRFRKGEMRGRSHMKTGTLRSVKSIAGYMLNRKGKWMIVVIHHNGPNTGAKRGSRIQNALLRWVFDQ